MKASSCHGQIFHQDIWVWYRKQVNERFESRIFVQV